MSTADKFRTTRHYRKLARSGAISGPGYTYFDFLGVRLTRTPTSPDYRGTQISVTWVPYGERVDSLDPDQTWLTSVDYHEIEMWAARTGTDYSVLYARFRSVIRTCPGGHPHLGQILTTTEVKALADRGCLHFECEVSKYGRSIYVYFSSRPE